MCTRLPVLLVLVQEELTIGRLVSPVSCVRFLRRLLGIRLLSFWRHALIRNSQHGHRKGRSCLTNLLLFLDKVLHGVNDGFLVDVVFLDLAKAFDKVPHKRLLEKLNKHGIGGKLLSIIGNWLSM